jgi:hypothetical protein
MRTKKKLRVSKKQQILLNKKTMDSLLEQYKTVSDEEIYKLSTNIISQKAQSAYDKMTLTALKMIIDGRVTEADPLSKEMPDITDVNLSSKIYHKKEFFIDRIPKTDNNQTLEQLTNKLCKFKLSYNQKFLKKFISTNTNYNGLLLFHGTGVGKTCSSISIAEQFSENITDMNKKIIILLNPSIKVNFIKNIFNIERLKQGKLNEQCTRDKYLKEVGASASASDMDTIDKKIKKIIDSRYVFYGYTEFSNMIEKIENVDLAGASKSYKNRYIDKAIKRIFSNTVMIIDEAHNIKEGGGSNDSKILPPILKKVLHAADNLKLILLSATPMFDNATEIVWLLNLLLINDGRQTIEIRDIFDAQGIITDTGRRKLLETSRGYISYLRGEHPAKFPKRLYPDIYDHPMIIKKFPSKQSDGTPINVAEQIKTLKLIGCPMTDYQLEKYNSVEMKTDEQDFGAFNINGMMASNIIFPSKDATLITNVISNKGFNAIIKKDRSNRYEIRDKEHQDLFMLPKLRKHSSKIASIIENIADSDGIIFIYSQFIASGVLSIAMALESNGYSKLGGSLMKGKVAKEDEPKYIMITGDNDLSNNAYQNYLKLENENMNGEKVKIIIGSSTAAEGLDFKYIREVHILDPWHHMNKLEQVIGRAIRNCSHTALPFAKRNVLVYLYAALKSNHPEKDNETIDMKMYRVAEMKAKKMAQVEYLLKQNAIDCNLNKEENRFIDEIYAKKYDIITSKNTQHSISFADMDDTKNCNYQKCDFKCLPDLDYTPKTLDTETYSYDKLTDAYSDIGEFLVDIFSKNHSVSIRNLEVQFYKLYSKDYKDVLYLSLEKFIKNDDTLYDVDKRKGVLRRKGDILFFSPYKKRNQLMTLNNARISTRKKLKGMDITGFNNTIRTKKKNHINKTMVEIEAKLKAVTDIKSNLIQMEYKYNTAEKTQLSLLLTKYYKIAFDYLTNEYKEVLIKSAITDKSVTYLDVVDANIIYTNRDYNGSSIGEDTIWGYKIAHDGELNYYKLNAVGSAFTAASPVDIKQINKITNLRIETENIPNTIIGYMEEKLPEKTIALKIRDKTQQGSKGTHIKTGSVCGNDGMKKGKIIDFIHTVLDNDIYAKYNKSDIPGKPNLCNELELYIRNNEQLKTGGVRWFYTQEEAIERNLKKNK